MTQNYTVEARTARQQERKEINNERLWEDRRDFSFLDPK
jgi:hypothetical protein